MEVLILLIFKFFKLEHPWNIDSIFSTFSVLKVDTSRLFKEEQLKNKLLIEIALEVSSLETSKDSRELHSENKYAKLVTKEVFKLFKLMDIRDLHPLNKYSIDWTWHVLKLPISKNCKAEQSENILFNEVILVVSNVDTSIEVNDSQPSNIWCINKTLDVLKFEISKCLKDFCL